METLQTALSYVDTETDFGFIQNKTQEREMKDFFSVSILAEEIPAVHSYKQFDDLWQFFLYHSDDVEYAKTMMYDFDRAQAFLGKRLVEAFQMKEDPTPVHNAMLNYAHLSTLKLNPDFDYDYVIERMTQDLDGMIFRNPQVMKYKSYGEFMRAPHEVSLPRFGVGDSAFPYSQFAPFVMINFLMTRFASLHEERLKHYFEEEERKRKEKFAKERQKAKEEEEARQAKQAEAARHAVEFAERLMVDRKLEKQEKEPFRVSEYAMQTGYALKDAIIEFTHSGIEYVSVIKIERDDEEYVFPFDEPKDVTFEPYKPSELMTVPTTQYLKDVQEAFQKNPRPFTSKRDYLEWRSGVMSTQEGSGEKVDVIVDETATAKASDTTAEVEAELKRRETVTKLLDLTLKLTNFAEQEFPEIHKEFFESVRATLVKRPAEWFGQPEHVLDLLMESYENSCHGVQARRQQKLTDDQKFNSLRNYLKDVLLPVFGEHYGKFRTLVKEKKHGSADFNS